MFVWKNFRNVFSGRDKLRRTLRNFLHTNYISIYSLLAGINPLAWDRTNHRLRSWANGVSQTNNDCRQAYFSFPSPSPVTSSFSLTPTPWDAFLSLSKPLPSLNPRWHSLDQTRSLARQNTPALQATHDVSWAAQTEKHLCRQQCVLVCQGLKNSRSRSLRSCCHRIELKTTSGKWS